MYSYSELQIAMRNRMQKKNLFSVHFSNEREEIDPLQ